MGTPCRYLKAYIEAREPGRLAILRFPLGVTLEDVGFDWAPLFGWEFGLTKVPAPTLPGETLASLSRLGVETVASGMDDAQASRVLRSRTRADADAAGLAAYIEDCLDANARLGGERCVPIAEYAMDTLVGGEPLGRVLRDRFLDSDGVRVYGDAAFREAELPDVLHFRVWNIVRYELWRQRRLFVPCRLHGNWCRRSYPRRIVGYSSPYWAVEHALDPRHRGDRVAVPRRLLDDMRRRSGPARHRAAREIMRLVLGALPDDAWSGDVCRQVCFHTVVAAAVAETCEEHAMLLKALLGCRSPRQMVRRSRDPSWVVSRTLERLGDRW